MAFWSFVWVFTDPTDAEARLSGGNDSRRINVLMVADAAGILSRCVKLVVASLLSTWPWSLAPYAPSCLPRPTPRRFLKSELLHFRYVFRFAHYIASQTCFYCIVLWNIATYYNESESSLINIAFFLTHGIARYRSWSETSSLRHTFKIVCVSRLLSWKQNKTKMYPFLISFSGVLKYF